jgi:hypothetical protein
MASSNVFAALLLALFLIVNTVLGEWVGHNLTIVEDNQSAAGGCHFEGTILNWTTHDRYCLQNLCVD